MMAWTMNAICSIVADHYARVWGSSGAIHRLEAGPMLRDAPSFHVHVIAPHPGRDLWTYATCGMSAAAGGRLETYLLAPAPAPQLVELVTIVAHYHLTGARLDLGHTVALGRPWLPGSACDHALLSLPYLDGPDLEWLEHAGETTRVLWLVPITAAERALKKAEGLEALEDAFEAAGLDYANPGRTSVV